MYGSVCTDVCVGVPVWLCGSECVYVCEAELFGLMLVCVSESVCVFV